MSKRLGQLSRWFIRRRAREVQLERYYALASDMLCTMRSDGVFIDINPSFSKILGFTDLELLNTSFYHLVHPNDGELTNHAILRLLKNKSLRSFHNRYRTKEGGYKILQWSAMVDPRTNNIFAIARDVTDLRYTEQSDQLKNELLDALVFIQESYIKGEKVDILLEHIISRVLSLTASPIGFVTLIHPEKLTFSHTVIRCRHQDVDGNTYYDQTHEEFVQLLNINNIFGDQLDKNDIVVANNVSEDPSFTTLNALFSGLKHYFCTPILGTGDSLIAAIGLGDREGGYDQELVTFIQPLLKVISATIQAYVATQKITHMAHYDQLTKLYSRTYFESLLKQQIKTSAKEKSKFGLFHLDLNKFKAVNDTHGHVVGDGLLTSVAKRLLESVPEPSFIGRIGGDEFAIVVRNLEGEDELRRLANTLKRKILRPYDISGIILQIGISIGIVEYPSSGLNLTVLQQHVDFALYEAKANATKVQMYNQAIEDSHTQRLLIEFGFDNALKSGEIYLEYQPQVDMRDGSIVGIEALCRWLHPQLGMLAPESFVLIIENIGKANILNQWVVKQLSKDLKKIPEKFHHKLQVSFNFSPIVYELSENITEIMYVLSDSMELFNIHAEVTEKGIMDESFSIQQFSKILNESKLDLSIDDFGVGYSSLVRLVELPVRTLKIDMEFVSAMLTDIKSKQVVISIINLAKSLHLYVVAEGVENIEQERILLDFGQIHPSVRSKLGKF